MSQFQHFDLSEFNCQCGLCGGENEMRMSTVHRADDGRSYSGVPWVINDGYRCAAEALRVGKPQGAHPSGTGFDVKATDSYTRYRILTGAIQAGFQRIGLYPRHIHLDDDDNLPQQVCWVDDYDDRDDG